MKARDFISEAPLRLKSGGRVNTGRRRQQPSMRDFSLTPGGSGNAAIERTKYIKRQAQQSARGTSGQPSAGNMRRGSSGNSVSQLQTSLQNMGYDIGSTGADGKFGKNTRAAVMKFQKDNGLKVDGIVGPNTRAAMQKAAQASQPSSTPAGAPGAGHPGEQSIYNTPKQTSNGPSFKSNVPDMRSGSFNVPGADPGAISQSSASTRPNPLRLASPRTSLEQDLANQPQLSMPRVPSGAGNTRSNPSPEEVRAPYHKVGAGYNQMRTGAAAKSGSMPNRNFRGSGANPRSATPDKVSKTSTAPLASIPVPAITRKNISSGLSEPTP